MYDVIILVLVLTLYNVIMVLTTLLKLETISDITEMTTLHRSSSQGSLGSNPPPDVPPRPRPISTNSDIIQTRMSSSEALNMSSSPGRLHGELGKSC